MFLVKKPPGDEVPGVDSGAGVVGKGQEAEILSLCIDTQVTGGHPTFTPVVVRFEPLQNSKEFRRCLHPQ